MFVWARAKFGGAWACLLYCVYLGRFALLSKHLVLSKWGAPFASHCCVPGNYKRHHRHPVLLDTSLNLTYSTYYRQSKTSKGTFFIDLKKSRHARRYNNVCICSTIHIFSIEVLLLFLPRYFVYFLYRSTEACLVEIDVFLLVCHLLRYLLLLCPPFTGGLENRTLQYHLPGLV